ncbi:PAS domain-containing protein [bacterium]|nr:PAS domain-containing protein [bacterium]
MPLIDLVSLRKNIIIYFSIVILIILIFTAVSVFVIQKDRQENREREYQQLINRSVEHVINAHIQKYSDLVFSISKNPIVADMIQQNNRKGLYDFLKPEWNLMQTREKYIKLMQFHLKDGRTFLRMQKPNSYGDKLGNKRAMMQEMHRSQKKLTGFETGRYGAVYRVIFPIFDRNNTYLGAIEIGVCPKYILETLKKINNLVGVMFIREDIVFPYSKTKTMMIDGYRLNSKLTPELRAILKSLRVKNQLADALEITTKYSVYRTHIFELNDFKEQPNVKIVFFQDISEAGFFRVYLILGLFVFMGFVLMLLTWMVHSRYIEHHNTLAEFYKHQLEKLAISDKLLLQSKNNLQNIFDTAPNIMITTNGQKIDIVNSYMLKFFGYASIEEFKKEHDCICDFFIESDHYIGKSVEGQVWLDYVLSTKNKLHNVCMMKGEEKHYFTLHAKKLESHEDSTHSVVVFNDITEVELIKDELEATVNELRIAKQQFDLFMLHLPFVAAIKDESYALVFINKQKGEYPGIEVIAQTLTESGDTPTAREIYALLERAKEDGKAEKIIKLEAGEQKRVARILAFAIPEDEGKVYVGIIYIDITASYHT